MGGYTMAGQPTYIYETGSVEWPPNVLEIIHSEETRH